MSDRENDSFSVIFSIACNTSKQKQFICYFRIYEKLLISDYFKYFW